MEKHTTDILELKKILDLISHFCYSPITIEKIKACHFYQNSGMLKTKLAEVNEFITILNEQGHFPLNHFSDTRPLLRKLQIGGSFLQPAEYYEIHHLLLTCQKILKSRENFEETYPLTVDKISKLFPLNSITKSIEEKIDEDGEVKDNASSDLSSIRKQLKELRNRFNVKVQELLQRYMKTNILREGYVTIRSGHHVFPVKAQNRTAISGIVYDQSDSGSTIFIEPIELVNFSNKILKMELDEKKEIDKILLNLANLIRDHLVTLNSNIKILSYIDALHARARFAVEFNGTVPKINDNGYIRLIQARHPFLLLKQKPVYYEIVEKEKLKEQLNDVIPLNIEFGKEDNLLVLISGPNTGGKTVALKTIGLLALMTYMAIPITASGDSEIPIYDEIYVDIGDEQSIEKGLSTFSSQIKNLIKIIQKANQHSLVLIDEIGNGTDPEEGSLLSTAIMDELVEKKVRGLITTHYGSLKVYAHDKKGLMNASMEFDRQKFIPTYHLLTNVPGNSYGLEIAKNLGFPHHLIQTAKDRRNKLDAKLSEIIVDLERKTSLYEKKLRELGLKENQLTDLIGEYEDKTKHISKYYQSAKEEALHEASKIIETAKSAVEKAVTEIKEKQAEKETIKQSREQIDRIKEEIRKETVEIKKTPSMKPLEDPKQGDTVWLESIQSTGIVMTISHHGPKVQVKVGNFKMLTSREDLFPVPKEKKQEEQEPQNAPYNPNYDFYAFTGSTQVDVRGLMSDQAIRKIEEFLSKVCVTDLKSVKLIHGLGNGVLKTNIRDYLKDFPNIKSFHAGDMTEGGEGVTIVELN